MMKLAYREYGQGRPLIILHGLFGQSDNWNTLARQFSEHQLRVFTLDQRNHGLSPHSDRWTYEDMANDLHEFIIEHRLESPILLGHSMGAKTVMFFEKNFPGQASQLIIADMSAREYPAHHQSVLEALNAVDFGSISNRREAEEILGKYISDFGTKQFLLKNIYWKEGPVKRMDWRFNLPVITRDYDNVRQAVPFFKSATPTLVVRGENSGYIGSTDIAEFEKRFSNLRVETIQGAGHWVHAEKPQAFSEVVLRFISGSAA